MPDDRDVEPTSPAIIVGLALVFAAIAALAAIDLALDLAEGASVLHVAAEGSVALLGAGGAVVMGRSLARARRQARAHAADADELGRRLEATRADAERWRRDAGELLRGLGAAIDDQFGRWQLTTAEREVALLLLKGLSHKEIASARGVGEPTVRQQAQAVYRKAGLAGRSELAAFFLEDLLPPAGAR